MKKRGKKVHEVHHQTSSVYHKEPREVGRDAVKLNSILVENFVNLQKSMTHLATKFDSLSDQISSLLQLFEISAKSFADKLASGVPDVEKDREFLDKLNKLLDQNKLIAKGLTLMEEKLRERIFGGPGQMQQQPQQMRRQFPISNATETYGYMPSTMEKERPAAKPFEE